MKKERVLWTKYPLIFVYKIIGAVFSTDKRIARKLPDCFPTYASFVGEFLNQFLRCIGRPRSFLPQGVIIEPTNFCNLRCGHCSARVNEEKRGYMDYGFYTRILDSNPQITCLMLSRYGEPFLHPRIFDMIAYAKRKNVYVFLYTNGALLSDKVCDMILASGLDEIFFSLEGIGEVYEKNRGIPYGELKSNIEYLLKKREFLGSNLMVGINAARIGDADRNIGMLRDEWAGRVDYIDTEPLIGTKSHRRHKSCRTLWRNAVIRWDGVVFPCCIDMNSSLAIGDLNNNTLKEIFNGPKATALRRSHLKKRFPPVCETCDEMFG